MRWVFRFHAKLMGEIRKLFLKLEYGKNLTWHKNLSMRKDISIRIKGNGSVQIGENVFLNRYCSINCLDQIEIGDNCIFGEAVKIYDHNHAFRDPQKLIREQGYVLKPVKIGENCWFGSNVIILPGVNIGKDCVIGAGAIIYKDIPDRSIVKCSNKVSVETIKYK